MGVSVPSVAGWWHTFVRMFSSSVFTSQVQSKTFGSISTSSQPSRRMVSVMASGGASKGGKREGGG